jgi:hypothetical protein
MYPLTGDKPLYYYYYYYALFNFFPRFPFTFFYYRHWESIQRKNRIRSIEIERNNTDEKQELDRQRFFCNNFFWLATKKDAGQQKMLIIVDEIYSSG